MQCCVRLTHPVLALITAFYLSTIVGCGGGGAAKTQKVSGKITDASGTPVKGAGLGFVPVGKGYQATGATGEDGAYQLTTFEENDGAAEGEYAVTISAADGAPLSITEGADKDGKVTVKSGSNTIDFKVSGGAAP